MRSLSSFVLAALAVSAVWPRPSFGASDEPTIAATILVRALAFDRRLAARSPATITVAVVWGDSRSATAERDEMAKAFTTLSGGMRLVGKPWRVVEVEYNGAAQLAAALQKEQATAAYVCGGLDAAVSAIREVARSVRISTLTRHKKYLSDGLSIGVGFVNGAPKLAINPDAAKAEGMDLDVQVMRVAEVVR